MKPVTQSRTGERGTCFRACIASILGLPESVVPDWPAANQDAGVNQWLGQRGLRYQQIPISSPAPVGFHTIEGISPRGGPHAVVGHNGVMVHDPHPMEGTGRGLTKPETWGLLMSTSRSKDAEKRDPKYVGNLREIVGNYAEAHRLNPGDLEIAKQLRQWIKELETATGVRRAGAH